MTKMSNLQEMPCR